MKKRTNKDVELLINQADLIIAKTIRNINHELINMYWNIGKMISDYKKENNSSYYDGVIKMFSEELYRRRGKGFNKANIYHAIKFYEIFSSLHARSNLNESFYVRRNFNNINWTHIRTILKFHDVKIICFYLNEVENKKLSEKQLINYIKSKSFERTIANQRERKIKHPIERSLRNPMILPIKSKKRTERELEEEIIKNILSFMKEIGNEVYFHNRQHKININGLIHKVDLVLFDMDIKSHILIDLKIGKITNKDVYQMKMYLKHFNNSIQNFGSNKPIGIILCETNDSRVESFDNIYQVKYLNEIPREKELLKIINENKIILMKTQMLKLESK